MMYFYKLVKLLKHKWFLEVFLTFDRVSMTHCLLAFVRMSIFMECLQSQGKMVKASKYKCMETTQH